MNKNYVYIDGMIEVTDELGNSKIIDYSDNIDEILVKENLIEQMKLEYIKRKKEQKHNKNISFKLLKRSLLTLLMIPVFLIVLPLILGIIKLTSLPIFGSILVIGIPTYLGFFLIYEYTKTNKINKGLDSQISFLKENINIETENLEKLKIVKSKKDEQVTVSVSKRVDDIQELRNLRDDLVVYYNRGYYKKEYQQELKQKKLRNKLLKQYSEEPGGSVKKYSSK